MRTKAIALVAAAALAGCGGDGGSETGSDQAQRDFIAGCTDAGSPQGYCECMYEEISGTHGIDSEEELQKFQEEAQAAAGSGDPSKLPRALRESVMACQDELQQ
jgi:hypothetical protein